MASVPTPAKDPQRAVIQALYDHFRSHAAWPEFDRVDRQLWRTAKIDVAQVAVSIPEVFLVTHGPRGVAPRGHDMVRLTLAGIERCDGGEDDVELFLRALRWLARYEDKHDPEPGETTVTVTRAMLAKGLRVPLREAGRLRRLFEMLYWERWGGEGNSRNPDTDDWRVKVGRDVRHFLRVRSVEDFLEATAGWLGPHAPTVVEPRSEPSTASLEEAASYIDERIFDLIKQAHGGRWDCTKLLVLLRELDDSYRAGNAYAAHALLRALLDHVPPLFGQSSFAQVANNHPWGRTDGKYVKRLVAFRDQADDVMHRQIARIPCLLSMEDMPPRAVVNRFLAGCADQLG
ncbi:hypothetical protein B5D80_18475 [Micromonospora wenchangensis]|uniref:Uncharacterized protein n=1 Tax=Micromonospora wenchangensis TaxID=1185415 RepID=A0A246RJT7_9ACTN|nr:hypothetical protein [Micromonospora wenchangensis]OWV05232.1 hypothetical protein B5D80_18475 [Micromonospora wenchangensis]